MSDVTLHGAAVMGDERLVRVLLTQGADVHERDASERTPLHAAASYGHVRAVKALLQAGADPDEQDETGSTALALAAEAGHEGVMQLLLRGCAARSLCLRCARRGAVVDRADSAGRTPLLRAASAGHAAIVQLLLLHGANPDLRAPHLHSVQTSGAGAATAEVVEESVLEAAAGRGRVTALETLVQHGVAHDLAALVGALAVAATPAVARALLHAAKDGTWAEAALAAALGRAVQAGRAHVVQALQRAAAEYQAAQADVGEWGTLHLARAAQAQEAVAALAEDGEEQGRNRAAPAGGYAHPSKETVDAALATAAGTAITASPRAAHLDGGNLAHAKRASPARLAEPGPN